MMNNGFKFSFHFDHLVYIESILSYRFQREYLIRPFEYKYNKIRSFRFSSSSSSLVSHSFHIALLLRAKLCARAYTLYTYHNGKLIYNNNYSALMFNAKCVIVMNCFTAHTCEFVHGSRGTLPISTL